MHVHHFNGRDRAPCSLHLSPCSSIHVRLIKARRKGRGRDLSASGGLARSPLPPHPRARSHRRPRHRAQRTRRPRRPRGRAAPRAVPAAQGRTRAPALEGRGRRSLQPSPSRRPTRRGSLRGMGRCGGVGQAEREERDERGAGGPPSFGRPPSTPFQRSEAADEASAAVSMRARRSLQPRVACSSGPSWSRWMQL